MQKTIGGIQQVGVGIPNVHESWNWYKQFFGMDIKALDDDGTAELMLNYTGGKPQQRHAILAMNLRGGGGLEIWQYKSRKPQAADSKVALGDLGIFAAKIKSDSIAETFNFFEKNNFTVSKQIHKGIDGNHHFFVKDLNNNIFQIVESNDWFTKSESHTGGVCGAIIGVSDIEKSLHFYKNMFGFDEVIYDTNNQFDDFSNLEGGNDSFRRVMVTHSSKLTNAFSNLYGKGFIELVQVNDRPVKKIFENRLWGDLGFIHLCFDVAGTDEWEKFCTSEGYPFTADSREGGDSFDMGEAAGSFAYIEDPDGTLIELVEAHKLPVLEKVGWSINLKNRTKPLPDWIVKMLRFKRVN